MSYKYDLISLDNDGTLADTEYPVNLAFLDTIHKHNAAYRKYDIHFVLEHCVGGTIQDSFDIMAAGLPPERRLSATQIDDITLEYQEIAPNYFAKYIKPDPERIALLENLSRHFKLCVVSNGRTQNVINSVIAVGAKSLIPEAHIFTPENTKKPSKPSPDLIIHAANCMGVTEMGRVLHLEDTARGAKGGIAANTMTVGCTWYAPNKTTSYNSLKNVDPNMEIFDNFRAFHDFAFR